MSRQLDRVRLKNDDLEDASDAEIIQFLVEHWIQGWEEEQESLAKQRKRAREITGTSEDYESEEPERSLGNDVDNKFQNNRLEGGSTEDRPW